MGYKHPCIFCTVLIKRSLSLLFLFILSFVGQHGILLAQEKDDCFFKTVTGEKSGILFENRVVDTERHNIVNMMNHWNGGGVAIGDYDNDGLPDIIFTGNQVGIRLYRNIGNLKFSDQTELLNLDSIEDGWNSGVSLVDIDNDGWKDIYICRRGRSNSQNLLLKNIEGSSFQSVAEQIGLRDNSFSTHAMFLDIDGNEELDLYLTNNEERSSNGQIVAHKKAPSRSKDRIFLQNNGFFTDVSDSLIPDNQQQQLGLAVCSGDFDWNGNQEIFVSNDLITEDRFLKLNTDRRAFSNDIATWFSHISANSMGCAVADINNDLWPDLYVVDMLSDNEQTRKLRPANNTNRNNITRNFGSTFQLMRNALQVNTNGNGFSETAMLFGLESTDWSWSPIIVDFNNDGLKDFFVTTSLKRDLLNLDYMHYYSDSLKRVNPRLRYRASQMLELFEHQPTFILENKLFTGSNLNLENPKEVFCINQKVNANGAAFGDLDLDGDLDLVVNNLDTVSFIYENLTSERENSNYIQFKFDHTVPSNLIMGAKAVLFTDGENQLTLVSSTMGFQSFSEPLIHFGLGNKSSIDSVLVILGNGNALTYRFPKHNQRLTINKSDLINAKQCDFKPAQNSKYEIKRKQLIAGRRSTDIYRSYGSKHNRLNLKGPIQRFPMVEKIKEDSGDYWLFSASEPGKIGNLIKLRLKDAQFNVLEQTELKLPIEISQTFRTEHAIFDDFNKNGTIDMIFCGADAYMRDTNTIYTLSFIEDVLNKCEVVELPKTTFRVSQLKVVTNTDDVTQIFIGYDSFLENYPLAPLPGLLTYRNNKWHIETIDELPNRGIKAVSILQPDSNGTVRILVCQENSTPTILNISKARVNNPIQSAMSLKGWWQSTYTTDIDLDGDEDIVLGNFGRNILPDVGAKTPLYIYNSDLDQNGKLDPIALHFAKDLNMHTLQHRDDLLHQVFSLKKIYRSYQSYVEETPDSLLGPDFMDKVDETNFLENIVLVQDSGSYKVIRLPKVSEYGSINHISSKDFNDDGIQDLLFFGNSGSLNPIYGMADGNRGLIIEGTFENESWAPGNTHHLGITGRVTDFIEVSNDETNRVSYILYFGNGTMELLNINYNGI